jgi:thioredoxin reductase (NADPH)
MAAVTVVGDGPTGLSAALFLAKNGLTVDVFGTDQTRMHGAYLYNYLGIPEMHGSEFIDIARGQCEAFGASLHDERVTSVVVTDGGFAARTAGGEEYVSAYLVLAVGKSRELAAGIGIEFEESAGFRRRAGQAFAEKTIAVNRNGETSVENAYAGGWATDIDKVQAAIAVGDGARIALDILSKEAGEPVRDFDVPR